MFIGLLFCMLGIATIIMVVWSTRGTPPPLGGPLSLLVIIMLIMILLLGWQVFGPLLKGPSTGSDYGTVHVNR